MRTAAPLVAVSPRKRIRWFGPLCFLVLLAALILQYRQTSQLRRAIDELRLAEQARALNSDAVDSETADLHREVRQLRDQLARLQAGAVARSDQPGVPVPSADAALSKPVDLVRWAALPLRRCSSRALPAFTTGR